ncbi:MAG: hypothetical protein ACOH1N_02105 [Lutibacter sp.]
MFIQCTSDPIEGSQGIAGIDGVDGVNGVNGVNGVDGTTTCVACHNDSHRAPIEASYKLSGHAAGKAVGYAGSRAECSKCHSQEGFTNYMNGKPGVAITSPSAIGCTTCHSKHSTFDFKNDGQDYALRSTGPVKLVESNASYTIDYKNTSNSCINCHQPRGAAPIDADNDGLYLQANSRFYPHYGGQSTMLEGINGSIIANGTTPYPVVGTAGHRKGASCTSCHMSSLSADGKTGLHTFKPNLESCKTCHTTVPTEVAGLSADMATLHNKLVTLGLIKEDGSTIVQTATIPFKTAQAIWNYKTVEEDKSNGIHNPKYARALVKNAIEAIQ